MAWRHLKSARKYPNIIRPCILPSVRWMSSLLVFTGVKAVEVPQTQHVWRSCTQKFSYNHLFCCSASSRGCTPHRSHTNTILEVKSMEMYSLQQLHSIGQLLQIDNTIKVSFWFQSTNITWMWHPPGVSTPPSLETTGPKSLNAEVFHTHPFFYLSYDYLAGAWPYQTTAS